mmetsp:Transcript_23122/g.53100  ORF Transcript_23122/g.53100 Transcript_23122/m.53100 type:complete len:236 (-) Transcript_23122:258-965(-)
MEGRRPLLMSIGQIGQVDDREDLRRVYASSCVIGGEARDAVFAVAGAPALRAHSLVVYVRVLVVRGVVLVAEVQVLGPVAAEGRDASVFPSHFEELLGVVLVPVIRDLLLNAVGSPQMNAREVQDHRQNSPGAHAVVVVVVVQRRRRGQVPPGAPVPAAGPEGRGGRRRGPGRRGGPGGRPRILLGDGSELDRAAGAYLPGRAAPPRRGGGGPGGHKGRHDRDPLPPRPFLLSGG